MKKTIKCGIVAAVAVAAGFAAYQSYGSYGVQDSSLLMQNVEALAQAPDGPTSGDPNGESTPTTYEGCLARGGSWGQYSKYIGSKIVQVEGAGGCVVKCGDKEYSLNFSVKKGRRLKRTLTEYSCVGDGLSGEKRNCCVKQGLFDGDIKIG